MGRMPFVFSFHEPFDRLQFGWEAVDNESTQMGAAVPLLTPGFSVSGSRPVPGAQSA